MGDKGMATNERSNETTNSEINIAPYPDNEQSQTIEDNGILSHVLQLGDEIPLEWIGPYEGIYSRIEIVVPVVIAPDYLWVVLCRKRVEHMSMMSDLMEFYSTNRFRYKVPSAHLCDNLYVVVPCYNRFCRAKILYKTKSAVQVFLIDTGLLKYIKYEDVFYLHKDFTSLPAQAIRTKLFNLIPYRKIQFGLSAKKVTQNSLFYKDLVGIIRAFDVQSRTLELDIIDLDENKNVNKMLRDLGHAEQEDTSID